MSYLFIDNKYLVLKKFGINPLSHHDIESVVQVPSSHNGFCFKKNTVKDTNGSTWIDALLDTMVSIEANNNEDDNGIDEVLDGRDDKLEDKEEVTNDNACNRTALWLSTCVGFVNSLTNLWKLQNDHTCQSNKR